MLGGASLRRPTIIYIYIYTCTYAYMVTTSNNNHSPMAPTRYTSHIPTTCYGTYPDLVGILFIEHPIPDYPALCRQVTTSTTPSSLTRMQRQNKRLRNNTCFRKALAIHINCTKHTPLNDSQTSAISQKWTLCFSSGRTLFKKSLNTSPLSFMQAMATKQT